MTISPASDDYVTFINVFEIAEDEIDVFVEKWKERSRHTTTADGFISAELHRAITADTEFQLVNVTKWRSMAHFQAAATAPEFRAELDQYQVASGSAWTPHRGFYRTVVKLD